MANDHASEVGVHLTFPGSIVVMGVSGTGKTSVGEAIAAACGYRFVEGDALHPEENIRKMSAGIPLTDADRWPWLKEIGRQLASGDAPLVVSCSALKRSYRDLLRESAGKPIAFVYLHGDRDVLTGRMQRRTGHFMPASLLDTQLATLEDPVGEPLTVTVDISPSPQAVIHEVLAQLVGLGVAAGR
ncbi:gluconokinase [Ensifer sp. B1-9]|uniref:gluconokinase n=1 Tax=Ensifer sp. B1-9 TaxID=3141455 RepID=UPI003D245B7E